MPKKIPITIHGTTEIEVDYDQTVYVTQEDILDAIEEDPDILNRVNLPIQTQFKNVTLLDSIKLQTISEILEKCTLEDLEKFKRTL
jgi:hypothetical protein